MCDATDPRDNIFGILGLASDTASLPRPDYAKPVVDVFAEFVAAMVDSDKTLDVLRPAGLVTADYMANKFPTWVADWTRAIQTPALTGRSHIWGLVSHGYCASSDRKAKCAFDSGRKSLKLEGVISDDVAEIHPRKYDENFCSDLKVRPWKDAAKKWIGKKTGKYPTGGSWQEAYMRTLTADLNEEGNRLYQPSSCEATPFWLNEEEAVDTDTTQFPQSNYYGDPEDRTKPRTMMTVMTDSSGATYTTDLAFTYRDRTEYRDRHFPSSFPLLYYSTHWSVPLYSQRAISDHIDAYSIWSSQAQLPSAVSSLFFSPAEGIIPDWPPLSRHGYRQFYTATFEHAMDKATVGREFLVTSEGYFGLAPDGAQVGDKVAVLFGCEVPLLLRPSSNCEEHMFVGECFVHGIMDGEALEQKLTETITLI